MDPFEVRYRDALADANVRGGLLPFQRAWRDTRDAQIAALERLMGRSFDDLRAELAEVKARVFADWPHFLDTFSERAEAAGSTVVRVATPQEANEYVAGVCREAGADVVVKGKSMVSEEIRLNDHLESLGIAAVETDLGEWLLQLAGEHPSHLVMPAIHKRREQIAELLTRVLGREFPPDDITRMVRSVRTELRDRFLTASVGLSGANALIAESGTVMLVCNEGNNRMSVAIPPIHVVTAGPEKLIPTFHDAMLQIRLLARSATGQPITTYTNFVTGPRPGAEQHILLIDNGRSQMAADPDFTSALGCIRCGACANVCPPYAVVGGHAFGHVYTGAIGLVNTPFHHSLEDDAGPQSLCVSCGACATVCPVEIPLPEQILQVRHKVAEELGLSWSRRLAFQALASRRLVASAARAAAVVTGPFRRDGVSDLPVPTRHTSWRTPPAIPLVPARTRIRHRPSYPVLGDTTVSGKRVLVFLQCLTDRLLPSAAIAAVGLLEAAGAEVVVPESQHCCGLPAYDSGDWRSARRMARATIEALEGVDDVVTPASSCVVAMTHEYRRLFRDDPGWAKRAQQLAERVKDLVDYLAGPARLPNGALDTGDRTPVTVHRFCQSQNTLGLRDEMESVLRDVCGVPVRPLPENGVCCGFGGSTSISAPEVAAGILERKLACVDQTEAPIMITNNPGCVIHLRGGAHASGRSVRIVQFAEYLGGRLERVTGIHP
ncbi:MAG: 4Fe-4S dicluster domain-containing protein [Nitriliruptorales bacterium]|nr:4Fe-4S dicluster domain-containing protein [Nitriliruptorales bacterium]